MIGTVPPSALQAAPVTYDARSEQRKTITAAISSGSGEPPERPPGADLGEHLVAVALLVGEPAVAEPRLGRRRAGRDGVAADAVLGVEVGDEPREREHRRLHHRVVGHRRATGACRPSTTTLTIAPLPRSFIPGSDRAGRAHRAHQVQLEGRLPVVVREVLELADVGAADVVDEAVDAAERARPRRRSARSAAPGCVRSAATCRSPMPSLRRPDVTTRRALLPQLAGDGEADPAGRAGDDAHLVLEAEIHRGRYRSRRDDDPPRTARRDRLEQRTPLAGSRRPAAERRRPRTGARARGDAHRPRHRRRLLERPGARPRDGADRRGTARPAGPGRRGPARGRRRRLVRPTRQRDRG